MDELLARIGWSKVYLSDRIGVDVRTLNRWAKRGDCPGYRVVVKYLELTARLMGC